MSVMKISNRKYTVYLNLTLPFDFDWKYTKSLRGKSLPKNVSSVLFNYLITMCSIFSRSNLLLPFLFISSPAFSILLSYDPPRQKKASFSLFFYTFSGSFYDIFECKSSFFLVDSQCIIFPEVSIHSFFCVFFINFNTFWICL